MKPYVPKCNCGAAEYEYPCDAFAPVRLHLATCPVHDWMEHIDLPQPSGEPCCSLCGNLELMVEKNCPRLINWVYHGVRMDEEGVKKFKAGEITK